jgi:Domain of Unknown Function (DUF1521)
MIKLNDLSTGLTLILDDESKQVHGGDGLGWGDPYVDADDPSNYDFYGTTTYKIDDGAKITTQTVPWSSFRF